MCTGLGRWQRALGAHISNGTSVTDPTVVKTNLANYLDGVVQQTGTLLKGLKAAGVPKVAHGAKIAAGLRRQFAKAQAVFTATRRRVRRLVVTDKIAFVTGIAAAEKDATVAFTTAQVALGKLGTKYPSPALDAALTGATECKALA